MYDWPIETHKSENSLVRKYGQKWCRWIITYITDIAIAQIHPGALIYR